jgi:hypothetical protein
MHHFARRNAAHCFMGGPKLSDCRAGGFQTAGTLSEIKTCRYSNGIWYFLEKIN